MNKKGAETTIGTIVVVVLAVLVLAVVIYGFSTGWNNLWERIKFFTPSAQSKDAVIAKCETMCFSNQKNGYCCDQQTVQGISEALTCDKLKTDSKLPIKCDTITCDFPC